MTRENVLGERAVPEERLGAGAEAGPEGGLRQAQGARHLGLRPRLGRGRGRRRAGGVLSEVAVVMGGVAPVPWRLKKAEDVLRGKPVTEALIRQAADAALADAAPMRENGYKTDLVFAALKRCASTGRRGMTADYSFPKLLETLVAGEGLVLATHRRGGGLDAAGPGSFGDLRRGRARRGDGRRRAPRSARRGDRGRSAARREGEARRDPARCRSLGRGRGDLRRRGHGPRRSGRRGGPGGLSRALSNGFRGRRAGLLVCRIVEGQGDNVTVERGWLPADGPAATDGPIGEMSRRDTRRRVLESGRPWLVGA
ncbi:MAG: hypothetical protein MZU79_06255 [Anaerotruncus sp.]|nr:hypothetical protein [Anaerotruncus sp.]